MQAHEDIYTSHALAASWASALWREFPRGSVDAATLVRVLVAEYAHGLAVRVESGDTVCCVTAQWCIVSRVRAVARRSRESMPGLLLDAAHAVEGVIHARDAADLAPLVKLLEDLATTITPL